MFYKLNEKESSIPSATLFLEISETQPKTSANKFLEPTEEKSKVEHFLEILPYNLAFTSLLNLVSLNQN